MWAVLLRVGDAAMKESKREQTTGSYAPVPPPPAEPERFEASFDDEDAVDAPASMPAPAGPATQGDAPMRSEERADEGEAEESQVMRRSSAPPLAKKVAPEKGGGFFGAVKRKLAELGGGGPRGPRRMKATARRVGHTLVITIVVKVIVGLRPTEEVESTGLDLAEHGEAGYEH